MSTSNRELEQFIIKEYKGKECTPEKIKIGDTEIIIPFYYKEQKDKFIEEIFRNKEEGNCAWSRVATDYWT